MSDPSSGSPDGPRSYRVIPKRFALSEEKPTRRARRNLSTSRRSIMIAWIPADNRRLLDVIAVSGPSERVA